MVDDLEILLRRLLQHEVYDLAREQVEVKAVLVYIEFSRLYLRKVEDVVYESQEVITAVYYRPHVLLLIML